MGHRHAPHGHDGVADELLDRAAVAGHDGVGHGEVLRQQLAGVLGVADLGHRREPDEVAEQDGGEAPLGDPLRRSGWGSGAGCGAGASGAPQSPQNFAPCSTAAPQAGQASPSGPPHSRQNFLPSGFSSPHDGHDTRHRLTPFR